MLAAGGVCVNPTTPVGDGDRADADRGDGSRRRRRRYRAYPRIGLNVVDVRDVARGHVLALEHGRPGERYLLGGVDLTMRELFAAVAHLAGKTRPRLPVPYAAIGAGAALGLVNRERGHPGENAAYFSSEKAAVSSGTGRDHWNRRWRGRLQRRASGACASSRGCRARSRREDQPDDQHAGDDIAAFTGGVGEQREHRARV